MDSILDHEREIIENLYTNLENLVCLLYKNTDKIDNNDHKNNFIDKLRLLNNSIKNINNEIFDLMIDLKNKNCILDENLVNRLEEEENTNRMIHDLSPLMLMYLTTNVNY